jgi:hypothetical protein
MAEVDRLSEIGFQHGENSRDSPTELKNGEWSLLVNIEPGEEHAALRGGTHLLRTLEIDDIDWVYPFRSTSKKKLFIGKSRERLVQFDTNGVISVLKEDAFPVETAQPCAERIGDTVIVTSDYGSGASAYAITMAPGGTSLNIREANIKRPEAGVAVSIEPLSGRRWDSYDLLQFPRQSCRMAAVTFINRRDEFSRDKADTPKTTGVWGDALAESWEDNRQRAFFVGLPNIKTGGEPIYTPIFDKNGVQTSLQQTGTTPVVTSTTTTQGVTVRVTGAMPSGCSHVRIWLTQSTDWFNASDEGGALAVASGSGLRFFKDVAVGDFVNGEVTVPIDVTEGELAGQNNMSDTAGANEIPPARQLKYHNGRLWATGARFGDSPGRSYYSNRINGLPSRSLSMFNLTYQFTDTSVDDTEVTMGMASSRGNLFFINENDVWILRDGEPSAANPPSLIAQGLGTTFPGTITENRQQAFYLSNAGPVAISGETVELLWEEFKVGDVWPKGYNGVGYFFTLTRKERLKVRSFWYKDIWYITDGKVTVGLRSIPGGGGGGFHLELAQGAGIEVRNFCKFTEDEAYILSGAKLCEWMGTKYVRDGSGFYYTAQGKTRGMRIDGRRRYKMAEAYDILALARWQDVGQLLLTLEGQFGRVGMLFEYIQRQITDPLQNTDVSNAWREIVQQAVPADHLSSWFVAGFQKVIRGDFDIAGLQVGILPREGAEFEYVSVSGAETLPTPDQELAIFDDRFNEGYDG